MTAEIILFPVNRETAFIRETARQLDRRNGRLAEKYWRAECNRLFGRLQVQGFSEPIIRAEIDRFCLAVKTELEQLNGFGQPHEGGDAA